MKQLNNEHLPKRLLYAIIFAALFSIVGWALPEAWYKYYDKTEYLTIVQPISVDKKEYAPCEETVLTTKLTAKVDVDVKSLTQLVLTNEKGDTVRVGKTISAEAPIRAKEEHIISGGLPLPCDLKDGSYFWQGNATYRVRGYDKVISFISDTFQVATESAEPTPTPSPTVRPLFFNTVPKSTTPGATSTPAPQPQAGQSAQPNNSTTVINNNPPAQSTPAPQPTPQPTPPGNSGNNPPVQICLPIVGCITQN